MTAVDDAPRPGRAAGHAGHAGPRRRSRGTIAALVVLGLLVVGALLVVCALPFLGVRDDGNSARANLSAALDALRDGDLPAATARVEAARTDVTSAQAAATGFRADVLGFLPVSGGAVDDVRHLLVALDQSVAVAEAGIELYPQVLGEDAALIRDGAVDLTALAGVTETADVVAEYLATAHANLDQIGGGTPVVGSTIADARDTALEQVVSLESTLQGFRPLLDAMPSVLGADEPRSYLVAVLNPSELRPSGGATLSMGQMSIDQGLITFGDEGATTDFTDMNEPISWEAVPGNPFHQIPALPLVNATMNPNWTTSAEELLRAWEVTDGSRPDGLIAMDVQAVAELFKITGPIPVEGYGNLTAGNFVQKVVGNYDAFRNDAQRKAVNEAVIPALRVKLLDGGKFVQKAQTLVAQAEGRHVVAYFRDPAVQELVAGLGLAGDLSTTTQDYLGVFTQNTNASKVDFWQRRTVASDVTLNADGSADVVTTVVIANDTPPFARDGRDLETGYYTRWSKPVYTQAMPIGAVVQGMTINGVEIPPWAPGSTVANYETNYVDRDRVFVRSVMTIEPTATSTVVLRYRVPQAAVPTEDGGLRYVLDIDPQGTVIPVTYTVLLHLPDGFREQTSTDDWDVNPDLTLQLDTSDDERVGVKVHAEVTLAQE